MTVAVTACATVRIHLNCCFDLSPTDDWTVVSEGGTSFEVGCHATCSSCHASFSAPHCWLVVAQCQSAPVQEVDLSEDFDDYDEDNDASVRVCVYNISNIFLNKAVVGVRSHFGACLPHHSFDLVTSVEVGGSSGGKKKKKK